jgi:hypothetical protein
MATIYMFIKPLEIEEYQYDNLKELLLRNSNINLNPQDSFIQTFKNELILIALGFIGIGFILTKIGWLVTIGQIAAFLGGWSLLSFIRSIFSYLNYLNDKSSYYNQLKMDIRDTDSYKDFCYKRISYS